MQENQRLAKNNFDLLRLLFAGTVCLVHAHALSGYDQLEIISRFLSSTIAVDAFFVVSGFLIFMSYERSSSLASYAGKRVRRIYPAYFTIVISCALGLVVVTTLQPGQYFSIDWFKYVFWNLSFLNFLHPSLPGVFEGHRVPAVNGALWTLKIEAMFYCSVPVFAWLFRKFGTFRVIVVSYLASVAYAMVFQTLAQRGGSPMLAEIGRQLPGQLCYFMAGGFLYYFLPLFERRYPYFLGVSILVLVADRVHALPLFEPFALAVVVVFCGLFNYVGNFGKYGDFSYGVYIIHFPVIQLLLHFGVFREQPWYFLTVAVVVTVIGAIAMWHLVEKRFLFRNSYYIAAAESPATSRN